MALHFAKSKTQRWGNIQLDSPCFSLTSSPPNFPLVHSPLATMSLLLFISASYCSLTNYPKIKWLKTTLCYLLWLHTVTDFSWAFLLNFLYGCSQVSAGSEVIWRLSGLGIQDCSVASPCALGFSQHDSWRRQCSRGQYHESKCYKRQEVEVSGPGKGHTGTGTMTVPSYSIVLLV